MQVPPIELPTDFREVGPKNDPTILLSANIRIGGTDYLITAVRMDAGLAGPDYRADVDESEYDPAIEEVRDGLDFVMGSIEPDLLQLSNGLYLLWIVPRDLG